MMQEKFLMELWTLKAGLFESYLVADPKDRFSRDKAHMN